MLRKVESLKTEQFICYHNVCKQHFLRRKVMDTPKDDSSEYLENRELHAETFTRVESYIRDTVVEKKRTAFITNSVARLSDYF